MTDPNQQPPLVRKLREHIDAKLTEAADGSAGARNYCCGYAAGIAHAMYMADLIDVDGFREVFGRIERTIADATGAPQ